MGTLRLGKVSRPEGQRRRIGPVLISNSLGAALVSGKHKATEGVVRPEQTGFRGAFNVGGFVWSDVGLMTDEHTVCRCPVFYFSACPFVLRKKPSVVAAFKAG